MIGNRKKYVWFTVVGTISTFYVSDQQDFISEISALQSKHEKKCFSRKLIIFNVFFYFRFASVRAVLHFEADRPSSFRDLE